MKLKFIRLGFIFTIFLSFTSVLTTLNAATWQKEIDTVPEHPRCVLLEMFTSSTSPPCFAGNLILKAILAQNDSVGGKYTLIKYQMDFPGMGDPYYTAEGGVRKDFYSVFGVPSIYVDNTCKHLLSEFTHQTLLDAQVAPAFCEIEAEYRIDNKTVTASAIIIPTKDFPANIHLFMAILEKVTYNNVTGSGERVFYQVMKKFMPDANGIPLSSLTTGFPIAIDQFYTFNGEYRLPFNADPANIINNDIEHSVENFNNLEVVIWAQNMETKEILQSATAKLSNMDQKNVYFNVIGENGTLCATTLGNPISSGTKVAKETPVTFTAEPDGEYKVKYWKLNGEIITDFKETEYTLTVNNNSIVTVEFISTLTAIDPVTYNVKLYPNPTTGELRILSKELKVTNIEIFDIYGRKQKIIINYQLPIVNSINISHLSAGIYFVKVITDDGIVVKKIVKL